MVLLFGHNDQQEPCKQAKTLKVNNRITVMLWDKCNLHSRIRTPFE